MKITPHLIRAKSPQGFVYELQVELAAGEKLLTAAPQLDALLCAHGWEPTTGYSNGHATNNGHAQSTDDLFVADFIEAQRNNGKTYYKVFGGPFTKFGVMIWPETLQQAGLTPADVVQHGQVALPGWQAHYIRNESGNPKKVVRLQAPDGQPTAHPTPPIAVPHTNGAATHPPAYAADDIAR